MLVGGVVSWFAANREQLGPLIVTVVGGVATIGTWGAAIWIRKRSADKDPSLAIDYLGLLGALLLSATVAWAESQFVILSNWTHHLLILSAIHAGYAYAMRNRLVLAVSVTALAAWFGIDRQRLFDLSGAEEGTRLLAAALAVLGWRALHILRPEKRFETVLEHAAVHLAFLGSLCLIGEDSTRWIGLLALIIVASLVGYWIRNTAGNSLHLIWLAIYCLIGVDIFLVKTFADGILIFLWLTASSLATVLGLIVFFIRRREDS